MRQIKQVRRHVCLDTMCLGLKLTLHPNPTPTQLTVQGAEKCLEVVWGDGARAVFHGFWLRDNAAAYFDPQTGQRIRNTLALGPDAYTVTTAERAPGNEAVRVGFGDGFGTNFTSAWLRQHGHETRQQFRIRPRLWANDLYGAFPGHALPTLAWADVVTVAPGAGGKWQRAGRGFVEWVTALRDYGVALLEGVPTQPEAAMRLADLISYHRKTHYGDTFQVVSEAKSSHLAYTPMELEVHTDLNYRESSPGIQVGRCKGVIVCNGGRFGSGERPSRCRLITHAINTAPPPIIQLLHCLASEAEGGESTFVDGFMVAETLRRESPEDFRVLCETPIPFRVKVRHRSMVN